MLGHRLRCVGGRVLNRVEGHIAASAQAGVASCRHIGAEVCDVLRGGNRQGSRRHNAGRVVDLGDVARCAAARLCERLIHDTAVRRTQADIAPLDQPGVVHDVVLRDDIERLRSADRTARIGQRCHIEIGIACNEHRALHDARLGRRTQIHDGREHGLPVDHRRDHPDHVLVELGELCCRRRYADCQTQRLTFCHRVVEQALHLLRKRSIAREEIVAGLRDQFLLDQIGLVVVVTDQLGFGVGVKAQLAFEIRCTEIVAARAEQRIRFDQILRARRLIDHEVPIRVGRQ